MMDRTDGYQLMHEGAQALAEMEANGMRLDVPYLEHTVAEIGGRIKYLEGKLRGCEEYKLQRRRYGQATNLHSHDQLGAVLFEDMGHEPLSFTDGGKTGKKQPQLDEVMLEKIGSRYTKGFIRMEKLMKLHGTYLKGLLREHEDGFVHAFFGLHLVRSYRGQSDSPNLQNIPIRDPNQGPVIRKAFIPRKGHKIVEIDYSGAEVRVACSLSGDEKLTFDVLEGDMHRDMAAECFMLDKDKVPKNVRYTAKGGFVFAEFYGDWYKQVCKNLWDDVGRFHLTTVDGVCLYEHLRKKGITERGACDPDIKAVKGTFEHHIQAVEDRFWNVRFKVYHAKRKAWVADYEKKGYIDLVTGFRCHGPMSKNQIINYPIQGPSFHCLLWSLTRVLEEIKKRKMKTKLTGQIHDSLLADVPFDEVDDYIAMANEIATKRLSEHWKWITVPMVVEVETSETNWFEKAAYKIGEKKA